MEEGESDKTHENALQESITGEAERGSGSCETGVQILFISVYDGFGVQDKTSLITNMILILPPTHPTV